MIISVLPVFLAYFIFYTGIGIPKKTVNYGQLIDNPYDLVNLVDENNKHEVNQLVLQKKWWLVIPISASCDEICVKNLYTTRQVHIRLDKKSDRIGRIALTDHFFEIDNIKQQHPYLRIIKNKKITLDTSHYYLVDQQGKVMMKYDINHTGNELLKDIKRALKYSIDYK